MNFSPKDLPKIKKCVNKLNKKLGHGKKIFWAYHPRGKGIHNVNIWHIYTPDGILYMKYVKGKGDLGMSKLVNKLRKKFPKLKFVVAYQHKVTKECVKSRDKSEKGVFVS